LTRREPSAILAFPTQAAYAAPMTAFHGHDDDFLYECQRNPQVSRVRLSDAQSRQLHNLLRPIRSAIWRARWIIRRIIHNRR